MLASSFLDTAIGIIFVFLLLSLIASSINEMILSLLNMRGRMLLDGIKVLLNDSDAREPNLQPWPDLWIIQRRVRAS